METQSTALRHIACQGDAPLVKILTVVEHVGVLGRLDSLQLRVDEQQVAVVDGMGRVGGQVEQRLLAERGAARAAQDLHRGTHTPRARLRHLHNLHQPVTVHRHQPLLHRRHRGHHPPGHGRQARKKEDHPQQQALRHPPKIASLLPEKKRKKPKNNGHKERKLTEIAWKVYKKAQ